MINILLGIIFVASIGLMIYITLDSNNKVFVSIEPILGDFSAYAFHDISDSSHWYNMTDIMLSLTRSGNGDTNRAPRNSGK